MYLCVLGKLTFSLKTRQDGDDDDKDLNEDQDEDVPFFHKMSEKSIKLDMAGLGKFIIMKSFMTSIHKWFMSRYFTFIIHIQMCCTYLSDFYCIILILNLCSLISGFVLLLTLIEYNSPV